MQLLRPIILLSAGPRKEERLPPQVGFVVPREGGGCLHVWSTDPLPPQQRTMWRNCGLRTSCYASSSSRRRHPTQICQQCWLGGTVAIIFYYACRFIVCYTYRLISAYSIYSAGAATDIVCSTACSCCLLSICPGLAGKCTPADGGKASGCQCSAADCAGTANAGSAGRCDAADDVGPGSIWRWAAHNLTCSRYWLHAGPNN